MYKIKELSSLFGMTTQAIRYYEKEGILMPDYVDPNNGYRYYDNNSVDKLSQIIQLRYLGFGINQVKKYYSNTYSKEDKIKDLKKIIDICNSQITNLVNSINSENNFEVCIKEINEFDALHSECKITAPKQVMEEYGSLISYAIKNRINLVEPFSVVLLMGNEKITTTLQTVSAIPTVTRHFNSQQMATLMYKGKHNDISIAYESLIKYLSDNNLTQCGDFAEKYFGPLNLATDYCTVELRVPFVH